MTSLLNRPERQVFHPLLRKLRSLGVACDRELDAVLSRVKLRAGIRRGEDIVAPGRSPKNSTILLDGVACLYERLRDGDRQTYAFQYSGDFCDLHRHVLPDTTNEVAVAAVTDCSVGIIEHKDLEQLIAQYPSLGLALWRASMLEASIFRKRLLNVGRQPALQRVAHLLCEQMARREAVGLNSATIPLTQMDLADAAGLSIVHVNRTFQELRRLSILSRGRAIEVVDRERLAGLAGFDGNYLNMPQLLSHWQVKIDGASGALASCAPSLGPIGTGASGRQQCNAAHTTRLGQCGCRGAGLTPVKSLPASRLASVSRRTGPVIHTGRRTRYTTPEPQD
jgi:CRP-like cAMP-binding protein